MYLLLIFLLLKSGGTDVRTKLVYNVSHSEDGGLLRCMNDLHFQERLYKLGAYSDGPPKNDIKKITGRCEYIDEHVASLVEQPASD